MTINRRRLIGSLALAAARPIPGRAEAAISLDLLRNVSAAHGTNFSDDRLKVIQPVLESRFPQLRTLREFEIDDAVGPTQGILDR